MTVEFDPDDVEAFIALADRIEEEFPTVAVEGNPSGVEPRPKTFEVHLGTLEGDKVYSRLSSKKMPSFEEVREALIASGVPHADT